MGTTRVHSAGPVFIPNAGDHELLPADRLGRISEYFDRDQELFVGLLGIRIEEIRLGYCRITMPFDKKITHVEGAVHGGALATMIDMAAVPAVSSHYDGRTAFPTIDLHIQYLADAASTDLTAVGWTTRAGRSIAFARAVVTREDGAAIALGQHTFKTS